MKSDQLSAASYQLPAREGGGSASRLWGATAALWLAAQASAAACPVCVGVSDSPLASGMNAGVLVLLAVTTAVLGAIFFVGRRIVRAAGDKGSARPEGRAYDGYVEGVLGGSDVGPTFRSGGIGQAGVGPTFRSGGTGQAGVGPTFRSGGTGQAGVGPTFRSGGTGQAGVGPTFRSGGIGQAGVGPTFRSGEIGQAGVGPTFRSGGTSPSAERRAPIGEAQPEAGPC